jgi:deoxyribonuclease-4
MDRGLLLGTHVSAAGGLRRAVERGAQIGCTAIQLFTKNNNRWEGKPLTDEDTGSYKTAVAEARIGPAVAHAAYLINLSAVDPSLLERSRRALEDELRRCELLGLLGLVVHPGAHMGEGIPAGIDRIAASINAVHRRTPGFRTLTILETTAGQGTSVGHRFEQLREIIDRIEEGARMAVCIDTCHLFAAGYPLHTATGWEETIAEFDAVVGLGRLALVHVNDSKKGLGSRVDRHEHIGKGAIGLEGFRSLMNDPRFAAIAKILETEKSEDMHEDIENMNALRSLIARHGGF